MSDKFEKYLYKKVFPEKPPETIFHYTTQKGILGIMEMRQMWATQVLFMNDKNEIFLTFQLLRLHLDRQIGKAQTPELRALLKRITSYLPLIDQSHICIASFCEAGDLLSQWRGYGAHGKGYAIGFDRDKLTKIAKKENFVLWPCVYSTAVQSELVEYLIDSWCQEFSDNSVEDKVLFEKVDLAVCQLAPVLKDASFSEEKEWRLVSSTISPKSDRFAFRPGQYALMPYYNFPIEDKESGQSIKKIVVGPSPHMELALNSLEIFLTSQKLHGVRVKSSQIPYRDWK